MNILDSIVNYNIREESSDGSEAEDDFINVNNFIENVFTRTGQTPLTASSMDGNRKMVETLLRNGANPNVVDSTGLSPLLASCLSMNSLVVTKALLSKGANVNAKVGTGENIYGETPLHYVIKDLSQKGEKQRLIFAQSLLKYGADPSLRSRVIDPTIGRKTLNSREYASLKGRRRLARMLRSSKKYKRKTKPRNVSFMDTTLRSFIDIPPMIHAVVFALLAGYASSTSYPALAGVSLGLAIFLTLLYLVVDYQKKRHDEILQSGMFSDSSSIHAPHRKISSRGKPPKKYRNRTMARNPVSAYEIPAVRRIHTSPTRLEKKKAKKKKKSKESSKASKKKSAMRKVRKSKTKSKVA